jgi:membrane protein implicated in regulation of membrane protease activity
MTWSDFYLLCFLVGFSLSALSLLAGVTHFHLPMKVHLPFHGHHHGGGGGALRGSVKGGARSGGHISWLNASTAMAFLAWFGGAGYILTNHSHFVAWASLLISTGAGLFAGFLVFRFMAKIIKTTEAQLLDWDFRVEGSVGHVSSTIRQGGVGEVLFEQNGVRKSVAARSEDSTPLSKGAEVAIVRYEDGIAYVKRWEEFTK